MDNADPEALRSALFSPLETQTLADAVRAELLAFGILAELYRQNSPASTALLADAARDHPAAAAQDLALRLLLALAQTAKPGHALAALAGLAIDPGLPAAVEIMRSTSYLPDEAGERAALQVLTGQIEAFLQEDPGFEQLTAAYTRFPPPVRARLRSAAESAGLADWTLVLRAAVEDEPQALEALPAALPRFHNPSLHDLGLRLLTERAAAGSPAHADALFRLYIDQAYAPAGEQLRAARLLPEDGPRRALFLFLSGQWEAYTRLDFNQALLSIAYENASSILRRRIVSQARLAGRLDWIQAVARGRRVRWLGDLTDLDWATILEHLGREQRWPELWRLAQVAPPAWSAPMLRLLAQRGWQPAEAGEQHGLADLVGLASQLEGTEPGIHSPVTLAEALPEIHTLAAAPGVGEMATGHSTGAIYLGSRERRSFHPAGSPTDPVWSLAFAPRGEFLASGHADGRIRIWARPGLRLVKTFAGHAAQVRALAIAPDGRTLASGGFDGALSLWRLPAGPQIARLEGHPAEIFTLAISPDGALLASAGADRSISLWTLPEGRQVKRLAGHTETITALAFSPDGQTLVSASRDHTIRLWAMPTGAALVVLEHPRHPLTGLAFHPDGRLFASVSFGGEIHLWSLPEGELLQAVEPGAEQLTGVAIPAPGDTLITAARIGRVEAWDLRPLLLTRLPVERLRPEALVAVERAAGDRSLSAVERGWLAFARALLAWRHRHDIALAEPQRIGVGEFDIELG